MPRRRHERERYLPTPPRHPHGPRGGLAGASDDFADYLHADEYAPRDDWDGWNQQGVYGRGPAHDRVDRGPPEAPDRRELAVQDYRGIDEDLDYGGRDSAAYYARHGGNAERMAARRDAQARRSGGPADEGLPVDPEYGLSEGGRALGRHYRRVPGGGPLRGGYGFDPRTSADSYGGVEPPDVGDARQRGRWRGVEEDPSRAWPGRDFPGGRSLDRHPAGIAPGEPGLAEPGYGSSPTRQAVDHRGRGPRRPVRSDARIREDICERLTEDPVVDATGIRVDCRDATVVLEGEVETRRMKHRAEDIADACPGVSDIDNRLRVRQRGVTRAEQPAPY